MRDKALPRNFGATSTRLGGGRHAVHAKVATGALLRVPEGDVRVFSCPLARWPPPSHRRLRGSTHAPPDQPRTWRASPGPGDLLGGEVAALLQVTVRTVTVGSKPRRYWSRLC